MHSIVLRRDRLDAERHKRHLHSDSQLAHALNVNKGTVSRVLTGRSEPGPKFIAAVVNTFGCTFEDLFALADLEPNESGSATQPEVAAGAVA